MKVMKFGGGTLKDGEAYQQVADVVKKECENEQVALVLSAAQGVTDRLHAGLKAAERSQDAVDPLIRELTGRHEELVREAVPEGELRTGVLQILSAKIARLERIFYGIAYTEETTEKTNDFVVSFGERLSCPVLAACLKAKGVPAAAFDADELGVLTDGHFGAATALLESAGKSLKKHLLPLLDKGGVPVITGYFGCDSDGRTTTFGRGGSDYSAAVVAHGLDADVLEVWKDVPGFMTADPKAVAGAREIALMSYEEAAELAYFGAKVLHPRIVEPAIEKGIPIRVRNLYDPDSPGTLITHTSPKAEWVVRSVARRRGFTEVNLSGPAMAYTPGLASLVFTALSRVGVNVYTMAASMASFSIVVEEPDAERAVEALEQLDRKIVQEINTLNGLSLVCVVGKGLRETKGIAGRTFDAVARAGVNVELISDSGSDIALNFSVKTEDDDKVIKALHGEFIREE